MADDSAGLALNRPLPAQIQIATMARRGVGGAWNFLCGRRAVAWHRPLPGRHGQPAGLVAGLDARADRQGHPGGGPPPGLDRRRPGSVDRRAWLDDVRLRVPGRGPGPGCDGDLPDRGRPLRVQHLAVAAAGWPANPVAAAGARWPPWGWPAASVSAARP